MANPTAGFGLLFYRDRRGGSYPEVKKFRAQDGRTFYRGQPVAFDDGSTEGRITQLPGAGFGTNRSAVGVSNQSLTTGGTTGQKLLNTPISVVLAEHALFIGRFDSSWGPLSESAAWDAVGRGFEFATGFAGGDANGGSTALVSGTVAEASQSWLVLVDFLDRPGNDILTEGAVGIFQWNPGALSSNVVGDGASPAPVTSV